MKAILPPCETRAPYYLKSKGDGACALELTQIRFGVCKPAWREAQAGREESKRYAATQPQLLIRFVIRNVGFRARANAFSLVRHKKGKLSSVIV